MSPAAASTLRRAVAAATATSIVAAGLVAGPAAARLPRPDPQGEAAIVVDARSGEVLLDDGADERHQIASTTKLMTALLLLERARLDAVFRAPRYEADAVESQIGLKTGERMRVRDLLAALLLESANDAAATIAVNVSGSRRAFVRDMNARARALGLRSTRYQNPIGFDSARNRSSARDLATLARLLLRDPTFAAIVDRRTARLRSGARRRVVRNRNKLVFDEPFVAGVKTGHTLRAGFVLVGAGERRGARVVSVLLGAPSEAARDESTLALLRWGLDRFRRVRVVRDGRPVKMLPVGGRDGERVGLETPGPVTVTARRGRRPTLRVRAPEEVEGPLPAGRRVGSVEVRDGGRVLRTAPLVTAAAVAAPEPLADLRSPAGLAAVSGAVLLAILGGATLVRVRSRRSERHAMSGR
ncbi:MAG TPA: serine hydrolase [Thermoleophilaceae bacterium]|nr:serine hydrolase [Thermoleophilaceae bacterium]